MRKFSTLILGLLIATFAFGKSVTMEQARQLANKYMSVTSLKSTRTVSSSFSKTFNGITTYYVFNYEGGGFIVVSADDAATPILAQSDEGFIETEITNPAARFWFENYSKEIAHIISSKADNIVTRVEWDNIFNNKIKSSLLDVAPLLTTTWDQTKYYNYYCPYASGGPDNKAYVGCVATTMGQIMKFHNFPARGVGSHSYSHASYGTLSANFDTIFNFPVMLNKPMSTNYKAMATLLYSAGVSVNMDYAADGSGAQSASVPFALSNYFNYDNKTIALAYMSNYSSDEWQALLISELDARRPLYYSGSDIEVGHAWVCDGYQTSGGKTMFHMNWGWGGSADAYYTIGSLNPNGYEPNLGNAVVYGIKPGNPNLIVRFIDLEQYNQAQFGSTFDIKCSVLKGTPTAVNLYIDKQVVFNTTQTNFTFPWNTITAGLGIHDVRVEAIDATDTVSWEIKIGISEWETQASGFTTPSRGIKFLHAVNPEIVWATANDGRSGGTEIQEFAKTYDGGNTWIAGKINNCSGLEPAMIYALNKDTAYVPMYKVSGNKLQGIYVTRNGGNSWTRQQTALFNNAASFPNVVHFFNMYDGFCMGDPIVGEYEIYTTSDGGNSWTIVPGANIPNPLSGDYGVVGFYSAVGNNAWFGTNKGLVYRSKDKGLHWDVSPTGLGEVQVDVEFKDALNGLALDKSQTGTFSETSDGGITWNVITSSGDYGINDFCYVPGTQNTWVATGIGAAYSFDGGHSWATFPGTETDQYLAVDFVSNQCGFAGSFNESATLKGMYKYAGILDPSKVLNPVTSLVAQPTDNSVDLTWTEPATIPLSYNIYRNDTLIGNTLSLQYTDYPVAVGTQDYCVSSVYELGQSEKSCTTAFIALNIPNTDEAAYRIYPNPSSKVINVITPVRFTEVRMINTLGKIVYRNTAKGTNLHILTEGFEPGMYILQIYTGTQIISKKVSIIR